jgi:hypothetical protein
MSRSDRSGSGPSVSGGGSIAVETDELLQASRTLAVAREVIADLDRRLAACAGSMPVSLRRSRAEEALVLLRRAGGVAETAADGVRTAAVRYGTVEHAVLDGQRGIAAGLAALTGGTLRMLLPVQGIGGAVIAAVGVLDLAGVLVLVRTVQRTAETGRVAPQADPVLLRALALVLSSMDDAVRGALLL